MIRIALTGGIGCGKSAVGQILIRLGAVVISLDDIAREVTMPNTSGLNALVKTFGKQILTTDKSLNRSVLSAILLKNQVNQQRIEAILHPKILAQMQTQIGRLSAQLVWVEVPRLTKRNMMLFDRAVVVNCTQERQIVRLIKRDNISEQQAKVKMAAQQVDYSDLTLPIDEINNDSNRQALTQQVTELQKSLEGL